MCPPSAPSSPPPKKTFCKINNVCGWATRINPRILACLNSLKYIFCEDEGEPESDEDDYGEEIDIIPSFSAKKADIIKTMEKEEEEAVPVVLKKKAGQEGSDEHM